MLKNLKKLRQERNISQQKLAEIVGVSQQSINKYENHNIEPDIQTLIMFADYFDTSIDYIVGYTSVERKVGYSDPIELNSEECDLVKWYRQLNRNEKKSIVMVIKNYLHIGHGSKNDSM
ncbi:MAG TPA: helix-turn-helix transcriptional regulator [Candidatus Ornithomonoglobus merdipullorum]|uniref:Helix-turn-helix transcriptional regulator n=1 Tax=Candidatus Ornithomonoglobus merdipullorum TaxID=2840895 RepID=A0A9D1SEH9_9FIRM|nr:helix-turn-helix transcriptional regulator [Candidatus Ornithomonoglobus merdipullorum]